VLDGELAVLDEAVSRTSTGFAVDPNEEAS